MKRPHVAVLFEFPTLNGGEHSMLSVIQHLQQTEQCRFSAIAPEHGPLADRLRMLDVPISAFSVRNQLNVKRGQQQLLTELADRVLSIKADIVHANSLAMSRLLGQAEQSLPSGVRRTGHLRDIIKLSRQVITDLNNNNGLVAVSNATRDFHINQGLNADRCCTIYNGVDTNVFRPSHNMTARNLMPLDVPSDAKIILNVGQICLRKGQLNLAESVCRISTQTNDIHFVLAGERHSSKQESIDYEAAIHQTFATAGLSDRVHVIGYYPDINELMNACNLLVHTARQEPFGRVLLEAAACGLPIVATNVGGTSELLRHNIDAILVADNKSDDLDYAICDALENQRRSVLLGKSARSRVEAKFSVQHAAEDLSNFWYRCLNRSQRVPSF